MSLGPVMLDLEGCTLDAVERERLEHPLVGGVILFTRNYESPAQLEELVASVHALRDPRLIVAVDQEGGRVQRFREGFTRLPPAASLGELYDRDTRQALSLAEQTGWLMAAELRAVGIDLSFAPVLDIGRGLSGVIGDRAFHRNGEVIAELARAQMRGMQAGGMAAVGKHFPGHGGVREDSHLTLPIDERRVEDILATDVLPFERMIHYGLAGIMPAHVVYAQADRQPAGFSRFWLQDLLRGRLGFQGVVFSDDLSMAGAAALGGFAERAEAALQAGCDQVLVCNHPEAADEVLDALSGYVDPASQLRLARLHGRQGPKRAELQRLGRWREQSARIATFNDSPDLELDV